MGEKKKKASQRRRGAKEMIARVNAFPVPQEDMFRFVEEVAKLEPGERDFEGHMLVAVRLFAPERDKGMSVIFRMEALARLLRREELPGWAKPVRPDGAVLTHPALFAAAGVATVVERKGEMAFDRDDFLRTAFELAKALRRE